MGSPGRPRGEPRRYAAPDGWTLRALQLALDPTPEQWQTIRRQWGGRRSASNWAVRTLKADLDAYRETGASKEPPSCSGLRWRWQQSRAGKLDGRRVGGAPRSWLRGDPVGSVGASVRRRAAVRGPHEAGLVGPPVRPGLPGHAARKREAREGNPVRGAA